MSGRGGWRFLDGALLAGLIALACYSVWQIIAEVFTFGWENEEQSHILAPGVALWLGWVRRERLRACRPSWTLAGPVMVGLGWLTAWYGFTHGYDMGRHLGMLLIVGGAALTILGFGFARRFIVPAAALLFLLPVPGRIRQEISLPLQKATAAATHSLMELFGFPVVRMGNVLTLNGHDVAVAEACNGMRMVSALALVSFAFVFSVPMRQSVRVVILALSPVVALLTNIIRLVPTVLMYGYAGHTAADAFHDISGWVMLFVALFLLWAALAVLRWIEVPIAPYAVAEE